MRLHRIPQGNHWVYLLLRSEGKIFVAKNGSFLEKEFLSKGVSGRKVELDEVLPLEPESSAARENVTVVPTPTGEEINDDDQGTSDLVATELRRSTRTRSTPEWYGNPVLEIMLLDNGEPSNYEEGWRDQIPTNGLKPWNPR